MIVVESWGVAGSVVDLGRAGRAWLGQSRGGAVDPASLALANRLVGNPEECAGIETSGGLVLRFGEPTLVVVTGAVADVTGAAVGWGSPIVVSAGETLHVRSVLDGVRTYIAVRGGVLRHGDRLTIGPDPGAPAATEAAPRHPPSTRLRVWPGPRLDWFTDGAWQQLLHTPFNVGATSRVGVRLHGTPLARAIEGELRSEGLLEGAIQVPPDGQPIVMLADHPTTGGYPVIAVVDPADIRHIAQAAVGVPLSFELARPHP